MHLVKRNALLSPTQFYFSNHPLTIKPADLQAINVRVSLWRRQARLPIKRMGSSLRGDKIPLARKHEVKRNLNISQKLNFQCKLHQIFKSDHVKFRIKSHKILDWLVNIFRWIESNFRKKFLKKKREIALADCSDF